MVENAIINAAREFIGTPYQHQASLKGVGCDCLGLIRGVWRTLYGEDPEDPGAYDISRFRANGPETLLEAARRHLVEKPDRQFSAGDVLLFRLHPMRPVQHCGIATSPTAMIHAHDGACVCEIPLDAWRKRLAFVFSFPPLEQN